MSIESVMPSNHLILCRSLLLLPSTFPSIRVFSNESVLHIRWPKYQSFSISISPSNEYSGLISFRMDWLDLLAVQRTLKSLLQHHCLKAPILQRSAFYIVQLSYPYITTGKTIAVTRWNFVGKVMSLQFFASMAITCATKKKKKKKQLLNTKYTAQLCAESHLKIQYATLCPHPPSPWGAASHVVCWAIAPCTILPDLRALCSCIPRQTVLPLPYTLSQGTLTLS